MIIFDLDNTLYDPALGVLNRIDGRINTFMSDRLGIGSDKVDDLRSEYWHEFGTTLRGLVHTHQIDPDDYLDFVHDVELSDLLTHDEPLGTLLDSLPDKKAIFSNASRNHAARVLGLLGVSQHFMAVVCLEDLGHIPKPVPEAYETLLAAVATDPHDCILVEDTLKNLAPAKALGMRTVWVSPERNSESTADHVIGSVHELAALLP